MKDTAVWWLMSLSSPSKDGARGRANEGRAWGVEQLGRQIKRNERPHWERPLTMCWLPLPLGSRAGIREKTEGAGTGGGVVVVRALTPGLAVETSVWPA